MLTYTTTLGNRDLNKLTLTPKEAADLLAAGFRFAEYDEVQQQFRLSAPLRLAHNLVRGTVTIEQQ